MGDDTNAQTMPDVQREDPSLDVPLEFTQRTYNELLARFMYVESMCTELKTSKDFLEATLAESEQKILALQVMVLNQSEKIQKLETNPPTPAAFAPSAKNEPKIPDPPMFNGERRALLPFLAKCRLKFVGQPSSFPTETAKIIYVGSRLEGPPFSWFSPLNDRLQDATEKDPEELLTFDSLAKHLTTLYGDPHLALTAERKLRALKQTTSVAHYIAEFEEHRQYLTWNEDALRDQLYLGLKDRIKDSLAPLERPSTLSELKEMALRLDSRLDACWHEKLAHDTAIASATPSAQKPWNNGNSSQNRPPPANRPAPPNASHPTPKPPPNTNPAPKVNFPTHTADGTVPMEINSRGGYRLTLAEKERRRLNNLCGYCGQAGHSAFNCPVAPPMNRPFNNAPRLSQQRVVMNIDVSDPSTIVPSPSLSSFSTGSQETPDSENFYARE
jgi:hypothetical protein